MSNRLAKEKSPYLLQHADNPVDWHPWSKEAFEKALREDKPVFLSIGYATCHWCHVMAHESFEEGQVADLMNRVFVNIKVDREERPDIDNTYMTVCQMLTGHGGWPLTVIMTPDKRPFFAATYIPKESRFNRPGMKELIPRIEKLWTEERSKVLESAEKISTGFSQSLELPSGEEPDEEFIVKARSALEEQYDPEHGGFGSQPKFPSPHNLTFLLQYSYSFENSGALTMAAHTLERMRLGGIYDHLGFGFHRYATDRTWLLPHFEKMLYDQALLMFAYSEGWRHTGDPLFKQTVSEIADYVGRQLTSPEGGFYSAEDADSEGEEGKFYVWKLDELQSLLGQQESALFADIYNFSSDGNFMDESTGRKTGKNIPHLKKRMGELAEKRGMPEAELTSKLEKTRKKLKNVRDKRIRPLCDDKVLTDWNGLMIAALAHAGAVFENPAFTKTAVKAWRFISEHLFDSSGELLHRYRDGEAGIAAMADDYAFLIWGLIELCQATLDPYYLESALKLNEQFMDRCLDTEKGGVFLTPDDGEQLLGRQKEIYDGAIPSSNSVAAMNLLRLARLTGRTEFEERSAQLFSAFSAFLKEAPNGATHALQSLIMTVKPSVEVVICGPPDDREVQQMIRTSRRELKEPFVILLKTESNRSRLGDLAPYTKAFSLDSAPAAYLCRQFKCEAPVHSAADLRELISK